MPELNWLAILVSAVVVFVVSAVYYVALSGRLSRLSDAYADTGQRPAISTFIVEVLRSLVVATVVAGLARLIGVADLAGALVLGLALWIGFPLMILLGSVVHERVPAALAAIHIGDWLLKLLIIATIVTLWR
jgi:Protein of unknown function (DUF1761)